MSRRTPKLTPAQHRELRRIAAGKSASGSLRNEMVRVNLARNELATRNESCPWSWKLTGWGREVVRRIDMGSEDA